MTLVRYGQAAMIAAILAVAGNAVSAQESWPQGGFSTGYAPPQKAIQYKEAGIYNLISEVLSSIPCEIKVKCCVSKECCEAGECCKNGKCCQAGDCCASKKCDAKCTCCKDSKCACCKDGECGCDKNGKCSCGKNTITSTTTGCDCPFVSKLAKHTAIIMVMPVSMPLPACCMEAMGMMAHPQMMPPMPMPPGPHVFMPPMMPPIPPTPSMGIGTPMMPPMPAVCAPPGCVPCPDVNTSWAVGQRIAVPCSTYQPYAAKSCIIAASSSDRDQLAMSIGEETSIRCKKMTIKIGENEITVSRFEDRVRVRGEDLKTTADCVRTDGKDCLILEGDVVLHYKKAGSSTANVLKADHIELNLSTGAVTMKQAKSIDVTPVHHESK